MIDKFTDNYRFLSNFYACRVEYEDILYYSAEHAYQASKAKDNTTKIKIRNLLTASEAKNEGSKLPLPHNWNELKIPIMEDILRIKFQDPYLRIRLKRTEPNELVEGNYWHDNFWGKCSCPRCASLETPEPLNNLGKLLMKIRSEIVL